MKDRQGFKTSFGVLAAAVGSAVGVGNIWRFPYITGKYGGGAFLIVYIIMVALIGIPLMISEMIIGRRGQSDAVNSFKNLAPNKKWYISGVIGVLAAFIIMGYYSVVAGWSLKYVVLSLGNAFKGKNPQEIAGIFGDFTTSSFLPLVYTFIILFITMLIVSKGVQKGIERASKILLPILLLILFVLGLKSISLNNSMEGIRFLFKPDFGQLSKEAILVAMGHAFYTLSLGMGIIVTYGSYIGKKESLSKLALKISVMDLVVALLAGIAIFPAVFSFGLEPGQGAGLVFTSLPNVFSQMTGGYIFSVLFFLLLTFAALTSTISLLEVVVAYLEDSWKIDRKKAALYSSLGIMAVFSSLSQGQLADFTLGGKNIFDFLDYLTANFMLLLAALIEVVFLGWFYKKEDLFDELDHQAVGSSKMKEVFYFLIKIVIPLAIVVIFISTNQLF